MRHGDYIQVRSGGKFFPLDPRHDEIKIEDIAWALSNLCRFTGHCEFYSVAQHSVLVSRCCDPADALAGLLHDASEAYTNDLSRPVKHLPELRSFRDAESRLQSAILTKYGLDPEIPSSVHIADNRLLATEVRDLMTPDLNIWGKWLSEVEPIPRAIRPVSPMMARRAFLERFEVLFALQGKECVV